MLLAPQVAEVRRREDRAPDEGREQQGRDRQRGGEALVSPDPAPAALEPPGGPRVDRLVGEEAFQVVGQGAGGRITPLLLLL